MTNNTIVKQRLDLIAQTIYDKKGFNILALDLSQFSSLTDFVIIAEGNIDRHLKSIASAIKSELADRGEVVWNIEGEQAADWIVLDYGDVIIHLLLPELRYRYALEELWKIGAIVDLNIDISKNPSSQSSDPDVKTGSKG